jgi:hypothetical protein
MSDLVSTSGTPDEGKQKGTELTQSSFYRSGLGILRSREATA